MPKIYVVQGKPKRNASGWTVCQDLNEEGAKIPCIFFEKKAAEAERDDWIKSDPRFEYRVEPMNID